jgi:hypothetical protein
MRISDLSLPRLILLHLCLFLIPIAAWPQTPPPQSRIVDRVNEGALVTLRGNTHPLAQPQFDQGAAPPDLPMARMLLVLSRSDAQESALQTLLDDQQDRNSPSYHQWLTPDEFGQQFGPSDQDVQTVAAWLRSHGFQIGAIGRGRTVIEFSGTASQVQQAFRTEIRRYVVNGEDHWANDSDPQIPVALAPVVEGVASLHNFPKRPMYQLAGKFSKDRATGRVTSIGSEFTTVSPSCSRGTSPGADNCYFVGPYDFATIYNLLPLWNATPAIDGTGQSIALADESNINVQDTRDFRNLFGLSPNDPQIIVDGIDPGLVSGAETEALLDVAWAGAVAKGATIKLVVSAPTFATQGADLAALYAIENSLAPVLSESFGECELFIGTSGNTFQNAIRQQAAAQGITFITSAGDSGSSTCDGFVGSRPEPAIYGLAVNGLGSSPYGVAVGGTDFLNFGSNYDFNSPSPYWGPPNVNNSVTQASALGYVPETTWNDSCTNNLWVVLGAGSTPEASCNNSQLFDVVTVGGGGGKSNCISSNGTNPSSCTGGYPKPSWQAAPGVPADGARDLPDLSLFAADGLMTSAYILCEADMFPTHGSCSLVTPNYTFLGIGGTSASAPAFAAIMALVNQYTQSSGQGNANFVLYKLASSSVQTSKQCGATSMPSSGCIFYDVTNGTIAQPCAKSSPDCNFVNASDTYGVLNGYTAGAGYDLATGLGSVNANNLVHNWIGPTTPSTTTLSLSVPGGGRISITHGQPVNFSIGVTPNAATGAVSLIGAATGSGAISMASLPLQNGSASGITTALAGGTSYQVKAHYGGDGIYKPSDSTPMTVTVAPEGSKTIITIPVFDPNTGAETTNTPASVVYGTNLIVRMDVGNAQAGQTFPEQLVCVPLVCPSGNVTLTDTLTGTTTTLSPAGGFPLSNGGYAEDLAGLSLNVPFLSGGAHQFTAKYAGDNSYMSSMGTYSLTVTPAPTQMSPLPGPCSPCLVGTPVTLSARVNATKAFPGAAPTGTITFYDGTTPIPGTVSYIEGAPGSCCVVTAYTGLLTTTFTTSGTHQISAKYSGDANYGPASSSATGVSVVYATTATAMANPATINLGQSTSITATVTGASKSPPMTGTFQFSGVGNPVPGTPGTDASGNQTLTATAMVSPQNSGANFVNYSGDSNYASASASISITVNLPDFSIGTSVPNLTITAGQTGTAQITLTPVNNVSDSVALSCNFNLFQIVNLPCSFNPPSPLSVSNGKAATTTLSIPTQPPSSSPSTTFIGARRLRREGVWPPRSWMLVLADGLAILLLSLCANKKKRRLAGALGIAGLLCLVLSCGSSSAGGGGGGGGPTPTSLTLATSSVKVQSGTPLTLTATVHSTNPVTGYVYFNDNSLGTDIQGVPINGVASVQVTEVLVGTHVMSAQYSGDPNNQPSQTNGSINQIIIGTGQLSVNGTGLGYSHSSTINVTIQ